ncbi:hypothetical protein FRC06_007631 [Ceratobasidium sp. 370]|nr:hypothetical protein FRC06_007631 [Ceratobasidium sp. 370]
MKAAVYAVNGSSASRHASRSQASVAPPPVVERPGDTHTGGSSGPSDSRRHSSVVQAAAGRFGRKGPLHIWDVPKYETFETVDGRRSTRVVWIDARKAGRTGAKKARKLKTAGSKETNKQAVGVEDIPTDMVGAVESKAFGKRAPTPSAGA